MILPHPHSLPPSRHSEVEKGHTLIELLVALALVGVCAVLPITGLTTALDRLSNRNLALVFQVATAAAQMHALGSASGCTVVWDGGSLTVASGSSEAQPLLAVGVKGDIGTNVARWRRGSGASLAFRAGTASPDSAGSLYFGEAENGQRVVVRLESGITRREPRW